MIPGSCCLSEASDNQARTKPASEQYMRDSECELGLRLEPRTCTAHAQCPTTCPGVEPPFPDSCSGYWFVFSKGGLCGRRVLGQGRGWGERAEERWFAD